jgi:hypothetical protein
MTTPSDTWFANVAVLRDLYIANLAAAERRAEGHRQQNTFAETGRLTKRQIKERILNGL